MAYITLNKAHTHHKTTINGQPTNQYSRYETGIITGSKRNLPAILANSTGSDGYSFDSAVGSDDDSWHVLNAFDKRGLYVDTIAVGGAMDSDHAVVVAQTQLDSLGASSVALIGTGLTQFDSLNQSSAGTFSIDALNKLMDNPSQDKSYLPVITASELAFEADRVTFDSVQWADNSNELLSHDGRDSTLMLDMTRADTRSDLVNEFELADVLDMLGAEPEQAFDALMDTKNRLPLLKDRLYNAMSRAGNDTVSVTNVTETKPFKRQGVTNIAFVFDLSDGQKLSIWFHNPDSTPSKLMPSDIMISWKWMLNKRDVTAALSPKQGDNVQLPVLASRIMRVAAKNSMRFKRTQARQLKLEQDLLDAQNLVDTKVATIEQLDKDIEGLHSQIDAAMKAPKVEPKSSLPLNANAKDIDDFINNAINSDTNEPVSVDEMTDMVADGNLDEYAWWEQTVESVTGLTEKQYQKLFEGLRQYANDYDLLKLAALRLGRDGWAKDIDDLRKEHEDSRVGLTPELRARRSDLQRLIEDAVTKAAMNGDAINDTEADIALARPSQMEELKNLRNLAPKSGEAIKSDDPDAIEKLEAKLGYLQAFAAVMRTANKHVRKGDDAALSKMGLNDKEIATLKEPDYAGRTGFADYQMTNNNGEMGRIKKRLKGLYRERELELVENNDSGEPASQEEKWPTGLEPSQRTTINALFDEDFSNSSDEILAMILLMHNSSENAIPKKDELNLVGAAQRLFQRKDLNKYYLEGGAGELSAATRKAYDVALAKLDSIGNKPREFLEFIFSQSMEPKTRLAESNDNVGVYVADAATALTYITVTDNGGDDYSTVIKNLEDEAQISGNKAKNQRFILRYLKKLKMKFSDLGLSEGVDVLGIIEDKPASEPLEDPLITSVMDFAKTHAGFNGFIKNNNDAEAALAGKAKGDWVVKINDDEYPITVFMSLDDESSYTGASNSDIESAYNDILGDDNTPDPDNTPDGPNNKKIVKGKSNKAKTPKGTKIESVFALVDAKFLIASHTANGSKNPKYPQELQPRDRARESSIAWVQKTSRELDPESLGRTGRVDTGAPIVGDDLVVESGNGRTIAIKMAYANGDASEYREWLAENADMFGMTAKQVESYKQPILVRMRTTQVNRSEFAVEANQDDKLSFTASERAKSDAKRVNAGMLELFDPSESGDILAASNRPFVKSFLASLGATEAAQYTDSNGNPTQALVARIKGALFSKAYDDDRLLEMMADQTKPELQNTLNALTMAAPKFVAAQAVNRSDAQDLAEKVVDSVEQSLSDEVKNAIVDATNMIMNAKLSNQDIKEYVLQQGLFEQVDDATAELAVFLAANARSAKKMTDYFNAMASYIEQDSVSRQNLDMFGEPEQLSLADVIAHANNQVNDNTDTIGTLDMFNETVIDEPEEVADDFNTANLAAKVDGIVNEINSSDFDPEIFDVDALSAIAEEAEGNSELTAKLEAASEVYQNKLMTIAMQAMSDMAGN